MKINIICNFKDIPSINIFQFALRSTLEWVHGENVSSKAFKIYAAVVVFYNPWRQFFRVRIQCIPSKFQEFSEIEGFFQIPKDL